MFVRSSLLAIGGLLTLASLGGWTFRSELDALLTNNVGAPTRTFPATTLPEGGSDPVRLAVAGDVGTAGTEAFRTAEVIDELDEQAQFDALLLLGDNIYPSGDPAQAQAKVFDPFGAVLDEDTELIAALGNHDVRDGNAPGHADALGMPHYWYATEIDDVLVITLDSNQPDHAEQIEWLRSTLSRPRPTWTIVMMHHPPFSAGNHGNDEDVQESFVPLFESYGVDLVLSGHDHDYQRSIPINGTTYIVTGAAAKLRDAGREDFTAVSWSTHSFVDLVVYPDRILGQAVDHDGRAIDFFVIEGTS